MSLHWDENHQRKRETECEKTRDHVNKIALFINYIRNGPGLSVFDYAHP